MSTSSTPRLLATSSGGRAWALFSSTALACLSLAVFTSASALSPLPPDCLSRTVLLEAVAERDAERVRTELAGMSKAERKRQATDALMATLAWQKKQYCSPVSPSPAILRQLLAAGADPNAAKGEGDRTFLMQAVFERQLEMTSLALDAGANPNASNYHESPLLIAIRASDEALVTLLLKRKADPNFRVGGPPEHSTVHSALATAGRHPGPSNRVLKALITGGAVHPKVSSDLQPIDEFAQFYSGRPEDANETVVLLKKLGANVNGRPDADLSTPLTLAVQSSHTSLAVIEALLQNGADPNRYVLYGLTDRRDYENLPLKRRDILEVLFKHGARVEKTPKRGTLDVRSHVRMNGTADFKETYLRELDAMSATYPN